MARQQRPLIERIEERFERRGADECWPWTAGVNQLGQPCIYISNGRSGSARRLYWEILNGEKLPPTRWVRATCRNQGCMNPRHMTLRAHQDDAARFWEKVDRRSPDECWEWTGTRDRRGYGHFSPLGGERTRQAHRFSWEMLHGPQPPHLFVCHRCDNPPCVNPAHLFIGTAAENTADMIAKGRHAQGPRLSAAVRRAHEERRRRLAAGSSLHKSEGPEGT